MPRGAKTRYAACATALSGELYRLALGAVARAKATGPDGHRSGDVCYSREAVTAVILSVAALEATINEVARELQSDGNLRIDRETFDRFKIRVKWRTLPLLCGYARTFDRGAAPWTGFDTLVKLRNELVHANWQRPEPACVLTLAKQGHLLRNPNEGSYSWCDAVCTDRVAQWATDVVAQMCLS